MELLMILFLWLLGRTKTNFDDTTDKIQIHTAKEYLSNDGITITPKYGKWYFTGCKDPYNNQASAIRSAYARYYGVSAYYEIFVKKNFKPEKPGIVSWMK